MMDDDDAAAVLLLPPPPLQPPPLPLLLLLLACCCWPAVAGLLLLAYCCWPAAAGVLLLTCCCWPATDAPLLLQAPSHRYRQCTRGRRPSGRTSSSHIRGRRAARRRDAQSWSRWACAAAEETETATASATAPEEIVIVLVHHGPDVAAAREQFILLGVVGGQKDHMKAKKPTLDKQRHDGRKRHDGHESLHAYEHTFATPCAIAVQRNDHQIT